MRILMFLLMAVICWSCKSDPKTDIGTDGSANETTSIANGNNTATSNGATKNATRSTQMNTSSGKAYEDMTIEEAEEKYKNDPKVMAKLKYRKEHGETEIPSKVQKKTLGLQYPDPCSILEPKDVASMFNVDVSEIRESNGNVTPSQDPDNKACFWRWNGMGMVIQIGRNPMPEDIPNFISSLLTRKKEYGTTKLETSEKIEFKDFSGPGTINIVDNNEREFHMSKGEDYMVSIIFNGDVNKRAKYAKKIAKKIFAQF